MIWHRRQEGLNTGDDWRGELALIFLCHVTSLRWHCGWFVLNEEEFPDGNPSTEIYLTG